MTRAYQAQWRIGETTPSEVGLFDLVIIDEASQSDIWALPVASVSTRLYEVSIPLGQLTVCSARAALLQRTCEAVEAPDLAYVVANLLLAVGADLRTDRIAADARILSPFIRIIAVFDCIRHVQGMS
jgi:hypothetical protein